MYGNNFNPYGFNPATNAPNTNPYGYNPVSPFNGQPQNTQPLNATNTNKIYVSGVEDVKGRMLMPNSDYMFIDNDKPIAYQKIVDGKGQFTVKAFKLVEFDPTKEQTTQALNPDEYVLKTDFDKLNESVKNLTIRLEQLKPTQGGNINGTANTVQAQANKPAT